MFVGSQKILKKTLLKVKYENVEVSNGVVRGKVVKYEHL
jgi:hypothetical protein